MAMSNALELLQELKDSGVKIEAIGDRLHLVGAVAPELIERIRPFKPEILEALRGRIKGPSALAGTWDVSHKIVAGLKWTLLTSTDGRQVCWRQDAWDVAHGEHGFQSSEIASVGNGRRHTLIERNDGLCWSLERKKTGDAA